MRRVGRWLATIAPPAIVLIAIVAIAQAWVRLAHVPGYLFPAPSDILQATRDRPGDLIRALVQTAGTALIGFAGSGVVGVTIAIMLASSRWIRRAFVPYTIFFQTVPVVSIAPLLLIWFGPGLPSVSACAFVVGVFPVIASTLAGLLSADPALVDLFTLYRASPFARLFKLRLPWALPGLFVGLRIAVGLSVIGAIVGEFVAGDLDRPGLGVMIVESSKFGDTAMVFAAIIAASLLGVALLAIVNFAAKLLLRHRVIES